MAYVWQNSISSGSVIKSDFYSSIQSTYTEVTTKHCTADYSTYKLTNYSNDNTTDNTSYTSSGTTCTAYRVTFYSGYDTDRLSHSTYYLTNKTSHTI